MAATCPLGQSETHPSVRSNLHEFAYHGGRETGSACSAPKNSSPGERRPIWASQPEPSISSQREETEIIVATNVVREYPRVEQRPRMGTLVTFLVLAFCLSWGPMALFMLFPDQLTAVFGEISTSNPFFILAVRSQPFRHLLNLAQLWIEGAWQLPSPADPLACSHPVVDVPASRYPCHSLHCCRDQGNDQYPVPLLTVVSGLSGAAPIALPWADR